MSQPEKDYAESGLAVEALKAGGATDQEAQRLVGQSLRNLQEQGVTQPARIPWNTPKK
jgi:hypothetical protein